MLHFIWTVKDRQKVLTGTLVERVRELLYECADVHRWTIKTLDIASDHVYLVVKLDLNVSPDAMIKKFQLSGKSLCKDFPDLAQYCVKNNLWSREYFVATQGAYEESMRNDYLEDKLE
jgi:putative transposase